MFHRGQTIAAATETADIRVAENADHTGLVIDSVSTLPVGRQNIKEGHLISGDLKIIAYTLAENCPELSFSLCIIARPAPLRNTMNTLLINLSLPCHMRKLKATL